MSIHPVSSERVLCQWGCVGLAVSEGLCQRGFVGGDVSEGRCQWSCGSVAVSVGLWGGELPSGPSLVRVSFIRSGCSCQHRAMAKTVEVLALFSGVQTELSAPLN